MAVVEIPCSGQLHQGALLPTTEFYLNKNTKRGFRSKCKACFHLYDKSREANIKRLHLNEKACKDCKEVLPLKKFYRSSRLPTGFRPECKDCYNIRRATRPSKAVKRTPEEIASTKLARALARYGLTTTKYLEMLETQGGKCAVCGGDNGGKRLVVDHDHACCPARGSCGRCVRSLLCDLCNLGLGAFKDSPELMQAAIQYVRGYAGRC